MPLGSKESRDDSKISIDYKSRLERKLCYAKETPEPVFDLSDCNLKNVPNNIFSLFKVFRKEALYLQNNLLTNLNSGGSLKDLQNIKILDISANKFSKLPSEICIFVHLEDLDVSKNLLQYLPKEIGCLEKLVRLDLSNNYLVNLPDSIGNCKNLEVLNVKFNESLKRLPATLGKLNSLNQLGIDSTITHPPREVCKKGVKAILTFLLQELNEDEETPSTSTKTQKIVSDVGRNSIQEQIQQHEKLKQEKQKQFLDIEKKLLSDQQKELELHQQLKDKKQKLLEDVKSQQEALNAELTKVQEKKNYDRALLLKLCQEEEKKSNDAVSKILKNNKKLRDQMADAWEKAIKQEEDILLSRSSETRAIEKKRILVSMDELMKEEILRVQKASAGKRLCAVQTLASEITKKNDALQKFISKFDESHTQLVENLRKNEELQKSAVASLLEKSDAASWELAKQVAIVQNQLAELTRIELYKKKLESDYQISELHKNRIALTKILIDLFDQQAERRKQLIQKVKMMESSRDSDTYWMEQYDKLLNSKSHEMVKFLEAVNPNLSYEMFLNGVFYYLPLLKNVALSEEELRKLDGNALSRLGIKSPEDRNMILRAIESFLKAKRLQPSAPTSEEPSAPSQSDHNFEKGKIPSYLVPEECVICLEAKPSVIFVPCGHVCCCFKCFMSIALCPLCRVPIDEIHEVVHPA